MAPRRNPDIVVAVLWEHGNWGNNSAKLASQIVNAYVTKQRQRNHNLLTTTQPSNNQPITTKNTTISPETTTPAAQ